MAERIGSPRDAASTLFNLPGYLVIAVGEEPSAGRWVDLEIEGEPHCSGCGVRGVRVHSSRSQRVRDIPVGGEVSAIWRKRRWFSRQHRLREEDVLRGHRAGAGLRPLHRASTRGFGRGGDHVGAGGQ